MNASKAKEGVFDPLSDQATAVPVQLEEALLLSQRVCTLLATPGLDALASRIAIRLARAHALSVVDQLTDLTQRQRPSG